MGARDPRIDAYIAKSAGFAKPILERLREWVHRHCPECVETMKWSSPHFEYKGKLYCGMSSFKEHAAFGFWHPLMRKDDPSLEGMGSFGKIRSVADLPSEAAFAKMAKRAMKLTDEGVKAPPKPKAAKKTLVVPKDLATALRKNAKAAAYFESLRYSHRKEYIEWIEEAKREETRARRVATTLAQLAEGKPLHWKYGWIGPRPLPGPRPARPVRA